MVLHLVFKILLVVAVDVEILLLENKETMAQLAGLEIYKPLRVKCEAVESGLEMEVRAGRPS